MNENANAENGSDMHGADASGLDKHDQVFASLVVSLQIAAMQQMGKITNPLTGEIERDLQQARSSIDILEMLKVKCRTGTPDALMQMLDNAVIELQMNYLDELAKGSDAADDESPPETEGSA